MNIMISTVAALALMIIPAHGQTVTPTPGGDAVVVNLSEVVLHDDGFDHEVKTYSQRTLQIDRSSDGALAVLTERYGFNPPVPEIYRNGYSFMFGADEYVIPLDAVVIGDGLVVSCTAGAACITHKRCQGLDGCRPTAISGDIANVANRQTEFTRPAVAAEIRQKLTTALRHLRAAQ